MTRWISVAISSTVPVPGTRCTMPRWAKWAMSGAVSRWYTWSRVLTASAVSSDRLSCTARAVSRRTSSSSGTSSSRMWFKRWPRSARVRSTSSAWAAVRGKPSSTAPCCASGFASSSLIRARMTASGTSLPSSMNFLASRPSGVPVWTAARRMSPVVIFGSPSRSARILPCVPFPEPGAPKRRMNTARLHVPLAAAELDAPFFHEPIVMSQQQVLLHLRDGVERDPHHDEQRGAAEAERHVEGVRHHDRQHGHDRQENGTRERDAGQHVVDIVRRGGAGLHTRDEATLLLQVLRQVHGVEDDRRVEICEENDQQRARDQVHRRRHAEVLGEVLQGLIAAERGDRPGDDDERLREDDRHHVRGVEPQRDERLLTLADPASSHHLARDLNGDAPRRDRDRHRARDHEHHDREHDDELRKRQAARLEGVDGADRLGPDALHDREEDQ